MLALAKTLNFLENSENFRKLEASSSRFHDSKKRKLAY